MPRRPRFNKHTPPYQGIDTMPVTKLFTYSNKAINMNTDVGLISNPHDVKLSEFEPFLMKLKQHLEYFGERTAPIVAILNHGHSLTLADSDFWENVQNFNHPVMNNGGFTPFLKQQVPNYPVLSPPDATRTLDMPHLYAISYFMSPSQEKAVRGNYENYHIIREFYSTGRMSDVAVERLSSVSRDAILETYTQIPLVYGHTAALTNKEVSKLLYTYNGAVDISHELNDVEFLTAIER